MLSSRRSPRSTVGADGGLPGGVASQGLVSGQVLLTPHDFIVRAQYLHARQTLTCLPLELVWFRSSTKTTPLPMMRFAGATTTASPPLSPIWSTWIVSSCSPIPRSTHRRPRRTRSVADRGDHEIDLIEAMAGGAGTAGEWRYGLQARRRQDRLWSYVDTVIANAAREDVVADAVAGARGRHDRPFTGDPDRGSQALDCLCRRRGRDVVVDTGARRALETGKSLLAAGVRSVDGEFDPGSPVEVVDTEGRRFKGLARHGSAEIGRGAGQRVMWPAGSPAVVIHADDLVTIPA